MSDINRETWQLYEKVSVEKISERTQLLKIIAQIAGEWSRILELIPAAGPVSRVLESQKSQRFRGAPDDEQ